MRVTKTIKNTNKNTGTESDIFTKVICNFKTPILAQIGALNSLLSTANQKINNEERELVELTLNSCGVLQNLIDVFLIAYKMSFSAITPEYEKFDFSELIKDIVLEFKILLKYYNIELDLKIPENISLYADKNLLKQIIKNLIFNNINTAYKGSKAEIEIQIKNSELEFQIKTQSNYLEPYMLKEIFEKEKKYNSQYSKPSISLGLYMLNKIIHIHYGSVFIKSYPNNVNIFGFILPMKK